MFDRIRLWSHVVLAFVCWKIFNHSLNFIACELVCLYFLFLPGSVSEGCAFLIIYPFLPGCPFYWHIVACSNLYDPLYFCNISCYFSFFISISIDLSPLFFSWWVWLMVYQFVYLLKEPPFSFIDLCYCFLCFYFIYFCSGLYDFFPSTYLGFCSFSSSFRCKVRLFIWEVSLFLEVGL